MENSKTYRYEMTPDPDYPDILFSNSVRIDADEPDYGEVKPSPFLFSPDDGLLEQVREAVRPVTGDGEFQFTEITYDDDWREGGCSATLNSPGLDIRFWFHPRKSEKIYCSFSVPLIRESFSAGELFEVLHIPVYFQPCKPSPFWEDELLRRFPGRDIIVIHLMESGIIEELYRICLELKKYMPAIKAALSPDLIDATLRDYREVDEKNHPKRPAYIFQRARGGGASDMMTLKLQGVEDINGED